MAITIDGVPFVSSLPPLPEQEPYLDPFGPVYANHADVQAVHGVNVVSWKLTWPAHKSHLCALRDAPHVFAFSDGSCMVVGDLVTFLNEHPQHLAEALEIFTKGSRARQFPVIHRQVAHLQGDT
jgi:hypothetical protein